MATNFENDIKYYIAVLPEKNAEFLGELRLWENVQMAYSGDELFMKGFTKEQAAASKLKVIPDLKLYEKRENYLFASGKTVPDRKLTDALSWKFLPEIIELTLPVQTYFQKKTNDSFSVKIIPSNTEETSTALMMSLEDLEKNISAIPAFRQQNLKWTVVDSAAVLIGTPMIGFPGATFWRNGNHFLPSGFNFEFPILSQDISYKINPDNKYVIFWNIDSTFLLIDKNNFSPLSVSSFRKTKLIL